MSVNIVPEQRPVARCTFHGCAEPNAGRLRHSQGGSCVPGVPGVPSGPGGYEARFTRPAERAAALLSA